MQLGNQFSYMMKAVFFQALHGQRQNILQNKVYVRTALFYERCYLVPKNLYSQASDHEPWTTPGYPDLKHWLYCNK